MRYFGYSVAIFFALIVAMPALGAETINGPIPARTVKVIDGDTIYVEAQLWLGLTKRVRIRVDGVRKAALARKMKVHPPAVDRLLSLSHASTMDQLDAAFLALGQKLTLNVSAAEIHAGGRIAVAKRGASAKAKPHARQIA